jgi:hypothetical protein
MLGSKLGEEFPSRTYPSLLDVLQSLPDPFASISESGDIEQPLISSGVLHHCLRFSFDSENHRPLRLLELLHEVAGAAAERREGLNVFRDIKHRKPILMDSTFLSAPVAIGHGLSKGPCNNWAMSPLPLLLMLAASFWESKPPADWTDNQLLVLFTDSPWAQMAEASVKDSHGGPVQVYIASAGPMQEGEKERERRYVRKGNALPTESPMDTEYRLWLEDNLSKQIVVAVRIPRAKDFDDGAQTKRMEDETIMHVGRKKFKMTGNFPPTARDPYLRIAFPREVQVGDKMVTFELYLPGATPPYRSVEFKVKDMIVGGKLQL